MCGFVWMVDISTGKILPRSFYERDPACVARDLLGNVLVRRLGEVELSGRIVEVEAYYGEDDPASKAYGGRRKFNELMFLEVGKTFIYMVHGNWLLNIVSHPPNKVGAVLIRAVEPVKGIEVMMKNRKTTNIYSLTNGPGKLTKAFLIDKTLNNTDVTDPSSPIYIVESFGREFKIESSHRIGVKKDLPEKLRFYIGGSQFVSKR
ncbi:MAG: DNA-3-methyladenine glycosylase [Nitrososphaerota archaeon]